MNMRVSGFHTSADMCVHTYILYQTLTNLCTKECNHKEVVCVRVSFCPH